MPVPVRLKCLFNAILKSLEFSVRARTPLVDVSSFVSSWQTSCALHLTLCTSTCANVLSQSRLLRESPCPQILYTFLNITLHHTSTVFVSDYNSMQWQCVYLHLNIHVCPVVSYSQALGVFHTHFSPLIRSILRYYGEHPVFILFHRFHPCKTKEHTFGGVFLNSVAYVSSLVQNGHSGLLDRNGGKWV